VGDLSDPKDRLNTSVGIDYGRSDEITETSKSSHEEPMNLSNKNVITIDLVEANVETNTNPVLPSIDQEVNMILESITTLPPAEREVIEILKSPTITVERPRRVGKKPLTQEQLQQQHYRNLQETTVIAVPKLPTAVVQDRTLEDRRDNLLENYPYREEFGPGWGSEPTPGDIYPDRSSVVDMTTTANFQRKRKRIITT